MHPTRGTLRQAAGTVFCLVNRERMRRGERPLTPGRSGDACGQVGQNTAWGTLWLATPQTAVTAWMLSPAHRANILDPRYRSSTVSVRLLAGRGASYTQTFCG